MDIRNKVAIVTGGASRIARAIARRLSRVDPICLNIKQQNAVGWWGFRSGTI